MKCWQFNEHSFSNGKREPRNDHLVPIDTHILLKNPKHFSTAWEINCAVDMGSVKCWGPNALTHNINIANNNIPVLNNPYQVTVFKSPHEGEGLRSSKRLACALDVDGAKCWGNHPALNEFVPLKHARQIAVGQNITCAIDDDGLKCWMSGGLLPTRFIDVSPIKNPRSIVFWDGGGSSDYRTLCAIGDDGLKCWSISYSSNEKWVGVENPLTVLKNSYQVDALDDRLCALDDDGVKCITSINSAIQRYELNVKNPRQLSVGKNTICVLDDDGMKCVGKDFYDPDSDFHGTPLVPKNPRQISIAEDYGCFLDDEGVSCDNYDQAKVMNE